MADTVLVLNSGSSSIKFGLFELSRTEPQLLGKGVLDEQEARPRLVVHDGVGNVLFEKRRPASDRDGGHLFADVLEWSESHRSGGKLRAVGHRVVHGGADHAGPVRLTDEIVAALEALTPLAPLHQPRCLSPIRAIRSLRPDLIQIACFDTAFHHGLAPPASRFAIPRRFEETGIRRYGFHGLSFEYIARRLSAMSPELAARRIVVAHLGNGASLCAMREGRSVDTTMSLTPLDGLVMGTRCGTIDPGVLLYLQQSRGLSVDEVQHLLYHESGLLGVSGISADMRTLLASRDAAAAEAIDLFTFRVSQQVAMMATALGGLDCLVFTGGIGEHSSEIRGQVCERLRWLGLALDVSSNAAGKGRISAEASAVEVFVLPTNEEMMIAQQCAAALSR